MSFLIKDGTLLFSPKIVGDKVEIGLKILASNDGDDEKYFRLLELLEGFRTKIYHIDGEAAGLKTVGFGSTNLRHKSLDSYKVGETVPDSVIRQVTLLDYQNNNKFNSGIPNLDVLLSVIDHHSGIKRSLVNYINQADGDSDNLIRLAEVFRHPSSSDFSDGVRNRLAIQYLLASTIVQTKIAVNITNSNIEFKSIIGKISVPTSVYKRSPITNLLRISWNPTSLHMDLYNSID